MMIRYCAKSTKSMLSLVTVVGLYTVLYYTRFYVSPRLSWLYENWHLLHNFDTAANRKGRQLTTHSIAYLSSHVELIEPENWPPNSAVTGRIAAAWAACRYFVYSVVEDWVCRPTPVTSCTNKREIWHAERIYSPLPRSVVRSVTFIGAEMWNYSSWDLKNSEFYP